MRTIHKIQTKEFKKNFNEKKIQTQNIQKKKKKQL